MLASRVVSWQMSQPREHQRTGHEIVGKQPILDETERCDEFHQGVVEFTGHVLVEETVRVLRIRVLKETVVEIPEIQGAQDPAKRLVRLVHPGDELWRYIVLVVVKYCHHRPLGRVSPEEHSAPSTVELLMVDGIMLVLKNRPVLVEHVSDVGHVRDDEA